MMRSALITPALPNVSPENWMDEFHIGVVFRDLPKSIKVELSNERRKVRMLVIPDQIDLVKSIQL